MSDEMPMRAYYYSFAWTGTRPVDKILSAVACAGKAFHMTEDWGTELTPSEFHSGETPIDWIQRAATEASAVFAEREATIREQAAEIERLREAALWLNDHAESFPGGIREDVLALVFQSRRALSADDRGEGSEEDREK